MYDERLDTFICAADSGSFNRAAELLFISPTAVMKQINSLENHLEIKLFHRTKSGIELTDAGRCIYRNAKQIIALSGNAVNEARKISAREKSVIRVGSSLMNPSRYLIDVWQPISSRHPEFSLRIIPFDDNYNDRDSIVHFIGTKVDMIVCTNDFESWKQMGNFLPLGRFFFCCTMPLDHPLASRKLLHPEDLQGETIFTIREGNSAIVDRIRRDLRAGFPDICLDTVGDYYDMNTFNLCEQRGIILLSLESWKEVHPSLVTIPVAWDYAMPYGIFYPLSPSKDIASFIDCIKEAGTQPA